jgi:very-short-patch-repair endonuclease
LQNSRRNLLDTSRRNRLINYRPSKASGIEVIGEEPSEILRMLVTEARSMTFGSKDRTKTPAPPAGEQLAMAEFHAQAEAELDEFIDASLAKTNQSDLILETEELRDRLGAKLLKIFRDARTAQEETGVNTLFLALGMLHWQEAAGDRAERRSPLVLVPVHLEPRKNGSFSLKYDGGEVGFNLSLAAAMRLEFGLELPIPPDVESIELGLYFEQIASAIKEREGWTVVAEDIALGFFSYAKYLLYADLDEEAWPDDSKPADHDILKSLLETGFEDHDRGYPSTGLLDTLRSVEDIHDVIGADGSQTLAVMEASTGRSMVIQGPPGTGKSQTITNLMADALARGKKVLFVAEKMAALDVVARRMTECGLGDACLQLHSQKARKTEFFAELRRVLEIAEPGRVKAEDDLNRLERARMELNAYSEAINAPIGSRGISVRDAMGEVILLGEEGIDRKRVNLAAFANWTEAIFKGSLPLIEALQSRFAQTGSPRDNPFFGSTLVVLLSMDADAALRRSGELADALRELQVQCDRLAAELCIGPCGGLADVSVLESASSLVAAAPLHSGVRVADEAWITREAELRTTLDALGEYQSLHSRFDAELRPEAWTADVSKCRDDIQASKDKWYRFLVGDYRAACRKLDALLQTPGKSAEEKLSVAEAIIAEQGTRARLDAGAGLAETLFGNQWQGLRSNPGELRNLHDWIVQIHRAIQSGQVPSSFLAFFERDDVATEVAKRARALKERAQTVLTDIKSLCASLGLPNPPRRAIESFASAIQLLHEWRDGKQALDEIVSFNKLALELRSAGLDGVVPFALDFPQAAERLTEVYKRSWYDLLIREAFSTSLPLQAFDRVRHEERIQEFRTLDDRLLQINRAKIRLQHFAGVPSNQAGGAAGWLLTQTNRKRNLASIRKAMENAGPAVQAIKPVFMMSPLSVAMYLPQAARMFDLIIFDEASQVKPEDSFGAILRGMQTVVVGDSKQMPPTSFFDKITGSDEDLLDEEPEQNIARDMESVLALMDSRIASQSPRRRDLRWHYRSRHLSLIEPSNALFYNHRLFLFPNPEPPSETLGLSLHKVSSAYDRGASRTNREEARAVVAAAADHVRNHSDESLMIVAFSQAQQQAIQDELDVAASRDPAFLAFAEKHPLERLDVKNLENVQGDERDAVFISIGYGRDASGYVSMSFGPLNAEGGERRLNVLITRARVRCEVFTNLTADDIKVEPGSKEGLVALKEFLQYAETGKMDVARSTGRETMSPFEDAVIAALTAKGYEAEPQVGCGGFFIDIGVRDPERPGSFVLGIECDGAQYHSARTARDRDKLRQAVLEDRGWTIHRIWSTNWFSDPKRELERVEEAIKGSKPLTQSASPLVPEEIVIESTHANKIQPYSLAEIQITEELTPATIAAAIMDVLRREGPIHSEELTRRIREAAGIPRVTNAFRALMNHALAGLPAVSRKGEFLRISDQPIVARDRSGVAAVRKIDLVSDWEIETCLREVVAEAFKISLSEASNLTAERLGFARVTPQMIARITDVATKMTHAKALVESAGQLGLPD